MIFEQNRKQWASRASDANRARTRALHLHLVARIQALLSLLLAPTLLILHHTVVRVTRRDLTTDTIVRLLPLPRLVLGHETETILVTIASRGTVMERRRDGIVTRLINARGREADRQMRKGVSLLERRYLFESIEF